MLRKGSALEPPGLGVEFKLTEADTPHMVQAVHFGKGPKGPRGLKKEEVNLMSEHRSAPGGLACRALICPIRWGGALSAL